MRDTTIVATIAKGTHSMGVGVKMRSNVTVVGEQFIYNVYGNMN